METIEQVKAHCRTVGEKIAAAVACGRDKINFQLETMLSTCMPWVKEDERMLWFFDHK